jgi:hypothetical protein
MKLTGKQRWVVGLMNKGDKAGALAYLSNHGMIADFPGAPQDAKIGLGRSEDRPLGSEVGFGVQKPAEGQGMAISPYSREQLVAMLADVDKAKAVAVQAERALDIPGDPNYKYPDFKPVRELVPEGVRWALVTRELGNVRQKEVRFEDGAEPKTGILWMGYKEIEHAKHRGRVLGTSYPIKSNPDLEQGGYIIYRK